MDLVQLYFVDDSQALNDPIRNIKRYDFFLPSVYFSIQWGSLFRQFFLHVSMSSVSCTAVDAVEADGAWVAVGNAVDGAWMLTASG